VKVAVAREVSEDDLSGVAGVMNGMYAQGNRRNTGSPERWYLRELQPVIRENLIGKAAASLYCN
jgi:hypothetical protein